MLDDFTREFFAAGGRGGWIEGWIESADESVVVFAFRNPNDKNHIIGNCKLPCSLFDDVEVCRGVSFWISPTFNRVLPIIADPQTALERREVLEECERLLRELAEIEENNT